MSKKKIRKKAPPQSALQFNAANPMLVGIPCDVVMVEHLCPTCMAGVMRNTGKMIEITPGRPGVIHSCTNKICEGTLTVSAPEMPFPRPDFRRRVDIAGHEREVGNLVKQMLSQMKEALDDTPQGEDSTPGTE